MKSLLVFCVPLIWVCLVHIYRYDYYVSAWVCMIVLVVTHYIDTKTRLRNALLKEFNDNYIENRDNVHQMNRDQWPSIFFHEETKKLIREQLDSLEANLSFVLDDIEKIKNGKGNRSQGLIRLPRQNRIERLQMKERVEAVKSQYWYLIDMVYELQFDEEVFENKLSKHELDDLRDRLDTIKLRLLFLEEVDKSKSHHFKKSSSSVATFSHHKSSTSFFEERKEDQIASRFNTFGRNGITGKSHVMGDSNSIPDLDETEISESQDPTSIVSITESVKSLPWEIEWDEENSGSTETSNEKLSDSISLASHSSHSLAEWNHNSRSYNKSNEYGNSEKKMKSGGNHANKTTNSNLAMDVDSRNQHFGPDCKNIIQQLCFEHTITKKSLNPASRTHSRLTTIAMNNLSSRVNRSCGNQEVVNQDVIDPYGQKGSYTGSLNISTSMPHGYGRMEYSGCAERWYEGDWKHGRWSGHGHFSNGDGDLYEGGLKDDYKHGHGIMRFSDGRIFEGEFFNGQMVSGWMTYQDKSNYHGSWKDGVRHGFGRFTFADHDVYEGEFEMGEINGYGKMTFNDGSWYKGEWCKGYKHGKGRQLDVDGALIHDGEWFQGRLLQSS